MTTENFGALGSGLAGKIGRRVLLAGASVAMLAAMVPHSFAADVSGDLVLLDWASGSEQDMIKALEDGFMKANPNVHFKEINLTVQGDARGAIRAALQSGEKADIFINTWPAFRKELADAGLLRDLGPLWDSAKLSDNLSDAWKTLGTTDGKLYGITYTFGDRSAMFYKTATMQKAGIATQPTNWADFVANFTKLNGAGVIPIAVGAKVWSHTEWFEIDLRAPQRRAEGGRPCSAQDSVDRRYGQGGAQEVGRADQGWLLRRRQHHARHGLGQRLRRADEGRHVRLPDDRHVEQRSRRVDRRAEVRRRLHDPAVPGDGRGP